MSSVMLRRTHHQKICVFLVFFPSWKQTELIGANLEAIFALCHYKYLMMSIPLNTNTELQFALHIFRVYVVCLPWKCKTSTKRPGKSSPNKIYAVLM